MGEQSKPHRKISNFIGATLAGILYESMTGPDTHTENLMESAILGIPLEFLFEKYGRHIPVLGQWLFTREYDDDCEIITSRTPYATAGWMAGQTIGKYLKQGSL